MFHVVDLENMHIKK